MKLPFGSRNAKKEEKRATKIKHYFVDFENVHSDGLCGIEQLPEYAKIYLLHSDNCKHISLEIFEKVMEKGVQIRLFKTGTGKNALDFQLSSLLGYVIKENEGYEDEFIIVSRDTGFDAVLEFWKNRGIKLSRVQDVAGNVQTKEAVKTVRTVKAVVVPAKAATTPVKRKTPEKQIQKATKEELGKYLTPEEYSEEILMIVNSYKTRTAINNALSKHFKNSEKSGAIYKKLKPLLKEKGKT